MKRIVNKYSCLFFFFIGSFVMLAQSPPTPGGVRPPAPPGAECCEYLYEDIYSDGGVEYQACLDSPAAHCPIPIDNSRYIYISMVAAVALASFVIARKMNTKKTPM